MARARNIKPAFFDNDELAENEPLGRLLFIGLWTLADYQDAAGRRGDYRDGGRVAGRCCWKHPRGRQYLVSRPFYAVRLPDQAILAGDAGFLACMFLHVPDRGNLPCLCCDPHVVRRIAPLRIVGIQAF